LKTFFRKYMYMCYNISVFILPTGRRTNEKGAQAVVDAFPEYNVTPINVPASRRLKSMVSMAGWDIIAVGNSEEAAATFKVK
jgi:dimethylargininase